MRKQIIRLVCHIDNEERTKKLASPSHLSKVANPNNKPPEMLAMSNSNPVNAMIYLI